MMNFSRIFLKENVSGSLWIAIWAIVLSDFEYKFNHFGGNEELLEDGGLLTVLGEDQKLCQELQRFEILKGEPLFEGIA